MSKVIAIVKRTCQVSPDDWERFTICKSFDSKQPIKDIIKWVESQRADMNTLMVRIDESEVNNG